jgi:hypothetical protein
MITPAFDGGYITSDGGVVPAPVISTHRCSN